MTIGGWKLYYRGPFSTSSSGWLLRSWFVFDIKHPQIRRIGWFGFTSPRF